MNLVFLSSLSVILLSTAVQARLSFGPQSRWAFVSGNTSFDALIVRGKKGVSAPENYPGSRCGHWIFLHPKSDVMYLVGGYGIMDKFETELKDGEFNDVWLYNFTLDEWTWVAGDDYGYSRGNYTLIGLSSEWTAPHSRFSYGMDMHPVSGDIYLFGGYSFSMGNVYFDDLWKWDPETTFWTWLSGEGISSQPGTYGVKGTESSRNRPGARHSHSLVVLPQDEILMFGGSGYSSLTNAGVGQLNDMWRFNIMSGLWTWVSGSNAVKNMGFYGGKGVESVQNVPPSRWMHLMQYSAVYHKVYMFGGWLDTDAYLNDLWQFDPVNLMWTWLDGSSDVNMESVYGTQGVGSKSNMMSGRIMSSMAIHPVTGSVFVYGGMGFTENAANLRRWDPLFTKNASELWQWDPTVQCWTWIGGEATNEKEPIYGKKNEYMTDNRPRERFRHSLVISRKTGELVLYGGQWQEFAMGDLWKLEPAEKQCPNGTRLIGDTCLVSDQIVSLTKTRASSTAGPTTIPHNGPTSTTELISILAWLVPVLIFVLLLAFFILFLLIYKLYKWRKLKIIQTSHDYSDIASTNMSNQTTDSQTNASFTFSSYPAAIQLHGKIVNQIVSTRMTLEAGTTTTTTSTTTNASQV